MILSLLILNPPWSPTKVWALPVGMTTDFRGRENNQPAHVTNLVVAFVPSKIRRNSSVTLLRL